VLKGAFVHYNLQKEKKNAALWVGGVEVEKRVGIKTLSRKKKKKKKKCNQNTLNACMKLPKNKFNLNISYLKKKRGGGG
jgi:hypothetical protein